MQNDNNVQIIRMQPPPAIPLPTYNMQVSSTRRWKTLLGIGVAEILIGGIILALDIYNVLQTSNIYLLGNITVRIYSGVWAGAIIMIVGILGVLAGCTRKSGFATAVLVCAIFAAIASFGALGIQLVNTVFCYLSSNCVAISGALHATASAFLFISFILTIVHSCMACVREETNTITTQSVVYTNAQTEPPPYQAQSNPYASTGKFT